MPHLAAALLILLLALPRAPAQAAVATRCPPDNPFAGQAGAAPEVYALRPAEPVPLVVRPPDGRPLIGDVGGDQRRRSLVGPARPRAARTSAGTAARARPCRPRPTTARCQPFPPLYDYPSSGPDVVIGGFVVRDPALPSFAGRYLLRPTSTTGAIARSGSTPRNPPPGHRADVDRGSASFGEDGAGGLYAATSPGRGRSTRRRATSGTLTTGEHRGVRPAVAVAAIPATPTGCSSPRSRAR